MERTSYQGKNLGLKKTKFRDDTEVQESYYGSDKIHDDSLFHILNSE